MKYQNYKENTEITYARRGELNLIFSTKFGDLLHYGTRVTAF